MIQSQTILRVCDNSGAKKVKCIKVLGGFRKSFATIGDLIVVSIQDIKHHKKKKIKIKEGEVIKALVVRSKSSFSRSNYSQFSFCENSVVLLSAKNKPIASRVIGSVSRELRSSKFMKVASLSSGLI